MDQIDIKVFPTDDALAAGAAAAWLDALAAAREAGRGFTVALSGGRVMRKFHAAAAVLAAQRGIDFGYVGFFWADERCVPPDAAESNYRQAREDLLEPARVSNKNIFPLRGEDVPELAAAAASAEMRRVCGAAGDALPVLDLVLLGMGEDGHVASLFPGDAATEADMTSVYLPVRHAPKPPAERITLGHGPLAAARAVWVLVSGSNKLDALRESLAATGATPLARVIQRRESTAVWTDLRAQPA